MSQNTMTIHKLCCRYKISLTKHIIIYLPTLQKFYSSHPNEHGHHTQVIIIHFITINYGWSAAVKSEKNSEST